MSGDVSINAASLMVKIVPGVSAAWRCGLIGLLSHVCAQPKPVVCLPIGWMLNSSSRIILHLFRSLADRPCDWS